MVVVHAYFSSSGTSRSPVKNNAFRTPRSSRTTKKRWCVCGKPLTFFKDAEAWACTECGHTEYIQEKQQVPTTTNSSGIGSVDGLSDSQITPNRGATKFRHIDPRSRFLKKDKEIDDELERILYDQGATLIA
jgi:hypothetical protein